MTVDVVREKNERYCEEIYQLLTEFTKGIDYRGWNNITSWHQYAEDVMRAVLEPALGYSIRNANISKSNEAAIDLIGEDADGRAVIVQVSSDDSRRKIQATLDSPELKSYKGSHLVFLFLVETHKKYDEKKPFANPHGVEFDCTNDVLDIRTLVRTIRHHSNPNKCMDVLDRLQAELEESTPMPIGSKVAEHVNEYLKKDRDDHRSFQLINHSPADELFPKVMVRKGINTIPNSRRRVVPEGKVESISFKKFLEDSWRSAEQRHLFITGKGGVGKTVALLTFATEDGFLERNVPSIYVPLYCLAKENEGTESIEYVSLSEYICEKLGKDLSGAIEKLSRGQWADGPRVLLLLDGYNELPSDVVPCFEQDIERWAKRSGVQIIATSRIVGLSGIRMHRFELRELTIDDVKDYLKKGSITVPSESDPLWCVLVTPLMLKLYENVSLLRDKIPDAHWLQLMGNEHPANAGQLIWNYLQIELYHGLVHRAALDASIKVGYAQALFLVLPYLCWRMERDNHFQIDDNMLYGYVVDACGLWNVKGRPRRFETIESRLRKRNYNGVPSPMVIGEQQSILTEEMGLLFKEGDQLVLMHQEFRDALAALHLKNVAEVMDDALPPEFDESFGEYVGNYLSELAEDVLLNRLWEANRSRRPTHVTATHNLLRVMYARHEGNLSSLSFAGMDLREVNLHAYASSRRTRFSCSPRSFDTSRVGLNTFRPQGHRGTVSSVCFSPKTGLLASGSWDGDVLLWDPNSRSVVSAIRGNEGRISSLCFSSDGAFLAYADDKGCLYLRRVGLSFEEDEAPNERGLAVRCSSSISSVCFSPENRYIAYGTAGGSIHLYDVERHVEIADSARHGFHPHDAYDDSINSVCFYDENHIAFASQDGMPGHSRFIECEQGSFLLHNSLAATSVCFSSDAHLLASGYRTGRVELRNTEEGYPRHTDGFQHGNRVQCVSFSPDGSLLASGSMDGTVLLWEVKAHEEIGRVEVGEGFVRSLCFSPDGRLVAAGSDDGSIYLIDVYSCTRVGELVGCHFRVDWATSSLEGSLLVLGSEDGIARLWNTTDGVLTAAVWREGVRFNSGCASPDGRLLALGTTNGDLHLWDVDLHTHRILHKGNGARGTLVDFSTDSRLIVFAYNTDLNHGALLLFEVNPAACNCVAKKCDYDSSINSVKLSRDGRLFVGSDNGVHVFLPVSGSRIPRLDAEKHFPVVYASGFPDPVLAVSLSPRIDAFATGSTSGNVIFWVWDGESYQQTEHLKRCASVVSAVCYSPDGSLLAFGDYYGYVYVWDTQAHKMVGKMQAHISIVSCVLFCGNGETLVSCSWDGTVCRWSVARRNNECSLSKIGDIDILHGLDLIGLDLSLAIVDDDARPLLFQNGVKVLPAIV